MTDQQTDLIDKRQTLAAIVINSSDTLLATSNAADDTLALNVAEDPYLFTTSLVMLTELLASVPRSFLARQQEPSWPLPKLMLHSNLVPLSFKSIYPFPLHGMVRPKEGVGECLHSPLDLRPESLDSITSEKILGGSFDHSHHCSMVIGLSGSQRGSPLSIQCYCATSNIAI
jgi:hypothetical protein